MAQFDSIQRAKIAEALAQAYREASTQDADEEAAQSRGIIKAARYVGSMLEQDNPGRITEQEFVNMVVTMPATRRIGSPIIDTSVEPGTSKGGPALYKH